MAGLPVFLGWTTRSMGIQFDSFGEASECLAMNRFSCSKYNPDDYRNKKLIWFKDDCKHHVRLSVDVFSGNTFALTATSVALIPSNHVSGDKENLIIPMRQQVSEDVVQKMERPKSRFLSNQCDFVVFQNSPIYQARYLTSHVPMIIKKFKEDAAIHFAKLGKEFADAAIVLYKVCQNQHAHPSWPVFYTACLALELYLKAFLRANGVSVDDLRDGRKFGHDLQRVLRVAKQKDLDKVVTITENEEHVIKILNTHYKNHDFRYKGSGEFTLAPVGCLISLLDRIDRPLFSICARAGWKT